MDPKAALAAALTGAAASRFAYNEWIKKGGFPATIKVRPHTDTWMRGIRYVEVYSVGIRYVHGIHPATKTKVKLPFAVVEVV